MIEIEAPDGSIVEFPDGTPDAEIAGAMRRKFGGPEPTTAPAGPFVSANARGRPEDYSGPSYVSPPGGVNNPEPGWDRALRLGSENLVSTINATRGLPVDLATMAINTPGHLFNIPAKMLGYEGVGPLVTNPVGGSQWFQERSVANAKAHDPTWAPVAETDKTPAERVIKEITEFAGQSAATGAGLATVASTRAAGATPRLGDSFLRTYAERPAYAVGADTVAGAGSGTGAGLAQERYPESPWAKFLGGLIGGPAGALGTRIGQGLIDIGSRIKSGITGSGVPYDPAAPLMPIPNRVADKASIVLRDAAGRGSDEGVDVGLAQAKTGLADTMRRFEEEGLPQPTAGLASNNTGLIGLEQSARREAPAAFVRRDDALRDAAAQQVKEMRPDVAPGDMRAPQQYAKGIKDEALRQADTGITAEQAKLNAASTAKEANAEQAQTLAGPVKAQGNDTAKAAASRQLDEQTSGALAQRTTEKNRLFDELPDVAIDNPDPVVEAARRIRAGANALRSEKEQLPSEFLSRLDRLMQRPAADPMQPMTGREPAAPAPLSLKELVGVRKDLNSAAETAQRGSNYDLAESVKTLKRHINEVIEKHPDAAAANDFYRNKYAPFFATGRGRTYRDAVQSDPKGRQVLSPEKTAEFWLNSTEDSAAHLSRIMSIAPDPQAAQAAARNYLIGDLARSVVDTDGRLNPVLMRQWLDNNQGKLRSPELAPVYNEIEALQRQALNNRDQGNSLSKQIRELNLSVRKMAAGKEELQRALDNGMVGVLLKNDPVNAAKAVIAPGGDPLARAQQMNKLLAKAPPNSRARVQAAWEAAVVDAISERISTTKYISGSDNSAISYAALKKELSTNNEVLAEIFRGQPEKMQNLRRAEMALEPLLRRAQQATVGSPTGEALTQQRNAQQNALMLEAGLKAYYGVLVGGSKMRTLRVLGRAITGDDSADVGRLVHRAFTEDPKLMQMLLNREPRGARPGYNKRANATIGAKEAYTDDEGDRQRNELRIEIRPDANQR